MDQEPDKTSDRRTERRRGLAMGRGRSQEMERRRSPVLGRDRVLGLGPGQARGLSDRGGA